MKKLVMLVLVVLMVLSVVSGCANSGSTDVAASDESSASEETAEATEPAETTETTESAETTEEYEFPEMTLVFSNSASSTSVHGGGAAAFCDEVERLTGGKVTFEYYGDGQLYKAGDDVTALINGEIDFTMEGANWLSTNSPWVSMFTAGYLFTDYENMTEVMNGEIGAEVFEKIAEEQGARPLSAYYIGTRQINLREDKEIKTPEDLNGVNLRMPDSDTWMFLGTALGANPTPLAISELYLALSTGVVDGQDNPLPTMIDQKFYEVTKSVTITNHYVNATWLIVNEAKWQSFSPELQDVILQAAEVGRQVCDEASLSEEAEAIDFLESEGLSIYYADIDAFRSHVLEAYLNDDISASWDMDIFNQICDQSGES